MASNDSTTGWGRGVVTVRANDSVAHAARVMAQRNVGALVVLGEGDLVAGILSERDILRFFAQSASAPPDVPVSGIMTGTIVSCSQGASLADINRLMVERGIRHVPVVEDGKALGMFSSRDVMARQVELLGEMKVAAEQTISLVKSLRTLNLTEVLTVAASEVPRLLGAERLLIRFEDGANPPEVLRRDCLCPAGEPPACPPAAGGPPAWQEVPEACRQRGGSGRRTVMSLPAPPPVPARGCPQGSASFLCICGGTAWDLEADELRQYRARLVQDILSTTLCNAVRYQEAHRDRNLDALTGVRTRGVLQAGTQEEIDRALRYGGPFCLAFLDVDRFKQVNDSAGHTAGDEVLRSVAAVLSACTRECDLVARYGGDEFVVLMPETALPEALAAAERLRKAVEERLRRPNGGPVTVSCGVAQWDGQTQAEELIARADQALYQVKRTGRNAVAAAPHSPKH